MWPSAFCVPVPAAVPDCASRGSDSRSFAVAEFGIGGYNRIIMERTLIISALLSLGMAGTACAADGPYYFIPVYNGAQGEKALDESYTVLKKMVALAETQHVRLTLMFSPQYADYIATSPVRRIDLSNWKGTGHEIGAWHRGPADKDWDGYTNLSKEALAQARRGKTPKEPAGGHSEYFASFRQLEPAIRTGCMEDKADREFLAAAPGYEICPGRSAGGKKARLSCASPSGRTGIEKSTRAFSRMNDGIYGASFNSSPADFGPFYAWLSFLKTRDPQGLKSRTVSGIAEKNLLPVKKPGALKPENTAKTPRETRETRLPRLKPVPDIRSNMNKGRPPRLKPVPGFYSRFIRFMTVPSGRKVIILKKPPPEKDKKKK